MARCTIPSLFGLQNWFDKRFKDLCEQHDAAYVIRTWRAKVEGDFALAYGFALRGYALLGICAFIYVSTLGSVYWAVKKFKESLWKR